VNQVPAEMIQAGGTEFHRFISSISNKEELSQQWKESVIVLVYKRGDESDCSNYREVSLLPTTYKIVSKLTPYIEQINDDNQCGYGLVVESCESCNEPSGYSYVLIVMNTHSLTHSCEVINCSLPEALGVPSHVFLLTIVDITVLPNNEVSN